ncbi:hypothetical protein MAR_035200 [Mya arenaria]|uniref:DDE Tnp4 domain-containing protein n=1 Tax=Mya arenaria TaxID=6604 RepID=A0ABY7ELY4_MYAAR|nr:hypothetical protein MAR_035200 [Mya arenaria]
MLAVCDHERFFTSVNASWPGSCHDAHVFRTSGLCNGLQGMNRDRVCIERALGRLMRRFHVQHSEIRLSPDKACRIDTACAIQHNIAVTFNMPEVEDGNVMQNDVGT